MVMPKGYKHSNITVEKIRSANTKQWQDKTSVEKLKIALDKVKFLWYT